MLALSQDAAEPQWGDATSDESDSELSHYHSRQGEALEAAHSVFADAAEEYGSLPAVKRRLEAWKREQPSAYVDAYMSMNVAAVMAPFVRLELLQWDPVYGNSTGAAHVLTVSMRQQFILMQNAFLLCQCCVAVNARLID